MKKFINFFTLIILFSSSFNISSNQEDIFGDISITSWRNNSFQYTKHGNVSIDTLQFLCGEITQREDFDGTLEWIAPRWIIIYKSSGQIAVRSPTAWADDYTVIFNELSVFVLSSYLIPIYYFRFSYISVDLMFKY